MKSVRLSVPYRSQESKDAKKYGNDCGIACVAMIYDYRYPGTSPIRIDYLASFEPPRPFSRTDQLVRLGLQVGLKLETTDKSISRVLSPGRIRAELKAGNPAILLVCYGRIPDRMNIKYTGGHYILAVGYEDEHFLVHDPDWYAPKESQGAYRLYHESVIVDAMKSCAGFFAIEQQGVFDWTKVKI